jgi:hypothetical protein
MWLSLAFDDARLLFGKERSFYIKKSNLGEGSYKEHGSEASPGFARWIRCHSY